MLVAVGREHLKRRDPDVTKAMRSLLDDVAFPRATSRTGSSSLSVARRHLLELAKAFAVSPRLLILDEPTAPLSQESVELLFTAVRKLAEAGTAVVYITHRLAEVRQIADRVTVLRDGRRPRDVRRRRHLRRRPPRADHRPARSRRPSRRSPPRRRRAAAAAGAKGSSGHGFDDISFTARQGEIVGIAGVVGNGQPALLRALAGPRGGDRIGATSAAPSSRGGSCSRARPTCRPTASPRA